MLLIAAISCNTPSSGDKKNNDSTAAGSAAEVKNDEPVAIPEGMKAEKSSKGFSIAVPEKWDTQNNYEGTDLMVFSPASGADDDFKENYSVIVSDAMGYKLDEFYSANVSVFGTSAPGFKKINEGSETLAGASAKWLEYEFTSSGVTVHGKQYYVIKNNRAGVITYSGSPKGFNDHLDTFNKALKTFTLD